MEELERYVTLRMEERGYTGVNLRTLQRDLQDIASLFGIRIKHEHGGYHIIEEDEQEWNRYEELLLNFDLLNALEGDSTLASYVLPEHHRPEEGPTPLPEGIQPALVSPGLRGRHAENLWRGPHPRPACAGQRAFPARHFDRRAGPLP